MLGKISHFSVVAMVTVTVVRGRHGDGDGCQRSPGGWYERRRGREQK